MAKSGHRVQSWTTKVQLPKRRAFLTISLELSFPPLYPSLCAECEHRRPDGAPHHGRQVLVRPDRLREREPSLRGDRREQGRQRPVPWVSSCRQCDLREGGDGRGHLGSVGGKNSTPPSVFVTAPLGPLVRVVYHRSFYLGGGWKLGETKTFWVANSPTPPSAAGVRVSELIFHFYPFVRGPSPSFLRPHSGLTKSPPPIFLFFEFYHSESPPVQQASGLT